MAGGLLQGLEVALGLTQAHVDEAENEGVGGDVAADLRQLADLQLSPAPL
ncbi:hypothetical protein [Nannocystis pusilla]